MQSPCEERKGKPENTEVCLSNVWLCDRKCTSSFIDLILHQVTPLLTQEPSLQYVFAPIRAFCSCEQQICVSLNPEGPRTHGHSKWTQTDDIISVYIDTAFGHAPALGFANSSTVFAYCNRFGCTNTYILGKAIQGRAHLDPGIRPLRHCELTHTFLTSSFG